MRPDVSEKVAGLGSGKDQGDAIAVFRKLFQPPASFTAIWRIAPYPAEPGLAQAVVFDGVVDFGHGPWAD